MIGLFPPSVNEGTLINIISVIHLATSHALPSPARPISDTTSTNYKRQIPYGDLEHFDRSLEEPRSLSKRQESLDCTDSNQCAEETQFCDYNNKCSYVCPLVRCTEEKAPDGVCVIRNHLPQCIHTDELREGEQVPPHAGCVSSSECGEKEWCYGGCENPCPKLHCEAWYDDGYCDVEDHQPVCKVPVDSNPVEGQPVKLSDGEACRHSYECKDDLNCRQGRCSDPCKDLGCMAVGKNQTHYQLSSLNAFAGHNYLKNVKINKPKIEHKCVVHLHVAKCALIHTDIHQAFEEVEA